MTSRITRRDFLRLTGGTAAASILAACSPVATPAVAPSKPAPATTAPPSSATATPAAAAGTPRKGGLLRYAYNGDPPTLDVQFTTTNVTSWVGLHMFETLFTYDDKFGPIPDLADSYDISSDGLTYTVKLRKGIPFHNGKEMTSEDVDASLRRWGKLSGTGKTLFERLDSLTSPDKYTMIFKLKSVYPLFETALAISGSQDPVIYPAEIVKEASDGEIKQTIGTGPYKFAEWQKDRFLRLTRFDNYVPHGDKPNGYGGKKAAYLDEIRYIAVPDQATRVAGILSGDYDYVDEAPRDQYPQLKTNPKVKIALDHTWRMAEDIINLKSAITSDQKLRQAMQAVLNCEEILKASQGLPEFYRLSPSLMLEETRWATKAGGEAFNQHNPDKAKQLLQQSNYKGQTLRWMTTKDFPGFYEEALVASQQIGQIGIKTDLQVMDWATLVKRRANADDWELFTSGWGIFTDPMLSPQFLGTYAGWWQSDKAQAQRSQLMAKPKFQDRFPIWEDLQRDWYDEVPCLYVGNTRGYRIMNPKLMDADQLTVVTRAMWNAWFQQ
ncbi:MAG: ABC transporter substrate-binding protein [Ardenticatenaceae bacterium]|nr:ABC transporter substrate-binding protein [Ardenticatenaceae bacterium]HBY96276.1 hypothetical protein [Chloroflexota bacterium]